MAQRPEKLDELGAIDLKVDPTIVDIVSVGMSVLFHKVG